jgi:hypothetical protein
MARATSTILALATICPAIMPLCGMLAVSNEASKLVVGAVGIGIVVAAMIGSVVCARGTLQRLLLIFGAAVTGPLYFLWLLLSAIPHAWLTSIVGTGADDAVALTVIVLPMVAWIAVYAIVAEDPLTLWTSSLASGVLIASVVLVGPAWVMDSWGWWKYLGSAAEGAVIATLLIRMSRSLRRRTAGVCVRCGYSLEGTSCAKCPECGSVR